MTSIPWIMTCRNVCVSLMVTALGILTGAVLMPVQPAAAANYVWDVNGASAGSGGPGSWDVVSSVWSNSGVWTVWPNTSPNNSDTAQFGGTQGSVTVSNGQTIVVNAIQLATAGYLFKGGDSGSVLAFSGANAQVTTWSGNNMGATFSNLTVNTGNGVTFSENGDSTPFTFSKDLTLAGSGSVTLTLVPSYGAAMNVYSTNNAGFAGGFNVVGGGRREAFLGAATNNCLGTGPATVSGFARLRYVWGAQAPVGGVPVGITAANAGVIDLGGVYAGTKDRFIVGPGGVLRGSTTDLARIGCVPSFSGSPSQPEAVLATNAIVACATKTSSLTLQNLPADKRLYFGFGADFDSALFAVSIGSGTSWKGFANDTQTAPGGAGVITRRFSAGTVTVNAGSGFSEIAFLTQGRGYGGPAAEALWAGSYQYNVLILGNNATVPVFTLASGAAIPARIMGGSYVALDGANFNPAAISKYIVSETAALETTRSGALNGRDVDSEGGVLGIAPGHIGTVAGVVDAVGTLTVSRLSRIYAALKTAGTPETLTISNLVRSGNAFLEVVNATAGKLGGDEKIKIVSTNTLVRGKMVDPFILATGNGFGEFLQVDVTQGVLTNMAYDAAWGNGNVVTAGTLGVAGTVSADSLRLGGNITNIGTGCTINLGVLPDGSQAARAGLINTLTASTVAPAINPGASELVVYGNQGPTRTLTLNGAVTAGGLTKAGNDILKLAHAANAIGGAVTVWNGKVDVSGGNGLNDDATVYVGALGAFSVTAPANSLETLAGLAGVGTVSIAAGKTNLVTGTLTGGDKTRSLTVITGGTLALGAGATAAFDLDYLNTPTGTPRLVMSSTALQIGSGARVKINSLANTPAGAFARTFVLAQYGSKTGVFASTVDAPEGVGGALVYDDANKLILLEVSPRVENGTLIIIR